MFDLVVLVIYVLGNYEYYDGEFGVLEMVMCDVVYMFDNVYYLNNGVYVDFVQCFCVLGMMFWSDFLLFGWDEVDMVVVIDVVLCVMFDFKGLIQVIWLYDVVLYVVVGELEWDFVLVDVIVLYWYGCVWLEMQLVVLFVGKMIVVFYYVLYWCLLVECYVDDLVLVGFVMDMVELVWLLVDLWLYGYMYMLFDYVVDGGMCVVCNLCGYIYCCIGEWENFVFVWDKVVEFG